MIKPAPQPLSPRLRASGLAPRRSRVTWLLALLVVSLVVGMPEARGQASRVPGRAPASRVTRQQSRSPEPVATPSATVPAPAQAGEPIYEFETGPAEGPYYAPGDGGGPEFGDEYFDDAAFYEQAGRYGGVGRYGCDPVLPHGFRCQQLYLRADYLLWWGKGFTAPPLVTTSTPGTSLADAGVLGLSSTSILFPTETLADASQSGGRARIGYWFDPCDTMAVEGTYFAIGQANSSFSANSADYPILARPFVNITQNEVGNDAQVIAYPGLYTGNVSVRGTSSLQGAEVVVRHLLSRGCDWRIDWTLGWRYNRLDDNLQISSDRVTLGSPTAPTTGAVLNGYDSFSTDNYFNGIQLGLITETRKNRWWLETRATLALGNNRAIVTIDGQTTTVTPVPGATSITNTYPGGLLAQPSNIGQYYNDDFAIVPQLGVNLGYEICCGLWATVGYNFMYWSRTARPGDQIDMDVNLSQSEGGDLIGLARPSFTGITTDYWAQGLNFGLAYRY